MQASEPAAGPLLETRSRASTRTGVAISIALHAAVIACLWRPQASMPAPDAQGVVTVMALSPAAPPAPARPLATPPRRLAPQMERRPATAPGAAPAQPAAAADSAQPTTGTTVSPAYFGELEALIRSNLVYPPGSIARNEEGICKVLVSFSRDGTIRATQLAQDSGHGALDEECREVFRRIGRFPSVPRDTSPNATDFSIELPITYSLQ